MQALALIIAILLLIPAALAGIMHGAMQALEYLDHLPAALRHAGALFAEIAPLGIGLGWMTAGGAVFLLAAWLIAGHFRS